MKKLIIALLLICCVEGVKAQTIGLQLYSLRNQFPKDVPGTLALIKSWGISELEGGGTYGLSVEEFKQLCKKNGLKVVSVGADFNDLEKDVDKVIKNAKAFGARFVMCAWIPHEGDNFTFVDAERAVKIFNAAGEKLAKEGLSFCYHAHGYEFRPYENGLLFDYMMEKTNPKFVNFEMDVYWIKQAGQSPLAWLNKHPKRFLMMHLKDRAPGTHDSNDGKADVETNVVLGKGDVGIADLMKAARVAGVKHYFIEDESSRVVEQVPQSLAFLKSIK
jgi:sugar phosphate isomerase/epimerase